MTIEPTDAEVEAAARAICVAKDGDPETLHQFNIFTGDEPFDHEDTKGRRYTYAWRGQAEYARAALLAAARAREAIRETEAVAVKPLEWTEITSPREDGPAEPTGDWEAQCLFGEYSVTIDSDEDMIETPWVLWSPEENIGHFDDPEVAKAAAQADYEARIRSALTHPVLPDREGFAAGEEVETAFIRLCEVLGVPATAGAYLEVIARKQVTATYRHKKRGSEYVLIGYGIIQATDWIDISAVRTSDDFGPSVDMREVAIYRSVTDPTEIWVRPREEFEDGRFELIAASPATGEREPPRATDTVGEDDGWMDIASAPKDGTIFWAITVHPNHKFRSVAFEARYVDDTHLGRLLSQEDGPRCHNLSNNRWAKPTHWRPLPAPPPAVDQGRAKP